MLRFGTKITVSLIRSGKGDCIHIRFWGDSGRARNIVIDSGPPASAAAFRKLYSEIVRRDEELDSVILTHYDEDHLGGLIKLAGTESCINIGCVYLNAVLPCEDKEKLAGSFRRNLSPRQNQELVHRLMGAGVPLETQITAGRQIELDGAVITVIAPDEKQLGRVLGQLETEEAAIQKKIQEQPQQETQLQEMQFKEALLAGECDWNVSLDNLMDKAYPLKGVSASNGASIVLVFEYDGYSFLFTGDAPAKSIVKGLEHWERSAAEKGEQRKEDISTAGAARFDLVKLPHHGSAGNISEKLLSILQTDAFVICADGSAHPDKMTISKLLKHYGNVMIYSNYSWWYRGFLSDEDKKYLAQGRLNFVNITDEDIELL